MRREDEHQPDISMLRFRLRLSLCFDSDPRSPNEPKLSGDLKIYANGVGVDSCDYET